MRITSRAFLPLLIVLALAACQLEPEDDSIPIDINGTWTLSTVQGAPANAAGFSGSIVVSGGNAYTQELTMPELGTSSTSGSVVKVSERVFRLTEEGGEEQSLDYTIAEDGRSMSATSDFLGPCVYDK